MNWKHLRISVEVSNHWGLTGLIFLRKEPEEQLTLIYCVKNIENVRVTKNVISVFQFNC